MAVDLCAAGGGSGGASFGAGSPRLSFSRDLPAGAGSEEDDVERTDGALLLLLGSPASLEFEFGVCRDGGASPSPGPTAADELFADGMILPLPMIQSRKQRSDTDGAAAPGRNPGYSASHQHKSPTSPPPPPPPPPAPPLARETLKEIMAADPDPEREPTDLPAPDERKPARHSFWGFRRSSSLSCVTNGAESGGSSSSSSSISSSSKYGGLFFSLPLLRRTKSAGSEPSGTAAGPAPRIHHQHQRQRRPVTKPKNGGTPTSLPRRKSNAAAPPRPPSSTPSSSASSASTSTNSSSSSSSSSYYFGPHRPGAASGGMRISPVINVPPACGAHRMGGGGIGSGFLGLGHLFLCSGGKKSVVAADQ